MFSSLPFMPYLQARPGRRNPSFGKSSVDSPPFHPQSASRGRQVEKFGGQQPRAGAVGSDQTPGGELPPPSHHPAAPREIPARFGAGDPAAQHRVPELGLGAFTWALRRARGHQVCAAARAQSLCCHQPQQSQNSFSWVSH